MDECEICGKKVERLYEVRIEGATLSVCARCANKREEPVSFKSGKMHPGQIKQPVKNVGMGFEQKEELIEDYGIAIKNARDKMQMPLKVMAEMLNEKETYLKRIEEQSTLPQTQLVKKLEKFLNIKLFAQEQ